MLKNMTKNQKVVLLSIFIAVIVLVVIMIFNIGKKEEKEKIEVDNTVSRVTSRDEWYSVNTCVSKFFLYYSSVYNTNSKYGNTTNEALNLENLYDFFDKEYIEKYGLTKNNIGEKIPNISADLININDIYRIQKRGNISMYLINSSIAKKSTGDVSNLNILVKMDSDSKIFSIYLDNYIKGMGYDKLGAGDKIDIELGGITNTLFSAYSPSYAITDDTYAKDLFDGYVNNCIYNRTRAYELLDDSVKKQKFPTLDSYIEYLKKKTVSLVTNEYKSYTRVEENGNVKYTCVDSEGNKYIFKEIAPMKYTVEI